MSWLILVLAGLLEIVWALDLAYTHGFTRPLPSVLTVAALIGSIWLLAIATKTLPIGTAYAVWVGIGAIGGMVLLGEPATATRLIFLALLITSIIGLELTTPTTHEAHEPQSPDTQAHASSASETAAPRR